MAKRYKISRYDGQRILESLHTMQKVRDYYYSCDSGPLYRKLDTICRKMDNVLANDLEADAQEMYRILGKL